MTPSPLLRPAELAAYGPLPAPAGHTDAELTSLLRLLSTGRPRIHTVAVGHSRDDASRAAAEAFTEAWRARGGAVLAVVDWPEQAASWLRPARGGGGPPPPAGVVAAPPRARGHQAPRRGHSTGWSPARTFGFAALAEPRAVALAGPDTVDGLRGATADGGSWEIRHGWQVTPLPPSDGGGR
ncbi:hypothetical protein ABTZ03_23195 [Kitasatospora sp. NPDC096077]|uniref:hypothetical protein n=1 Tax=Kitasatospora sp. NPDC096077 TaxID=3155544 RepID=UPI00331F0352